MPIQILTLLLMPYLLSLNIAETVFHTVAENPPPMLSWLRGLHEIINSLQQGSLEYPGAQSSGHKRQEEKHWPMWSVSQTDKNRAL